MTPADHDCEQFSQRAFDTGELVCIRCSAVTQEESAIDTHVGEAEGRVMNGDDHYSGNGLLNSETENMDYVSAGNKGLAFKLNSRGKDYQGKRIRTKLNDPYKSGNLAGGKGMVLKVDPLTQETSLKFAMYETPMLRLVKERAFSELTRYGLSNVEQTIVAKECRGIVSNLFFAEMLEYAWRAAVLNAGVLKEKDAQRIEQELYKLADPIRVKVLSHGDKKLAEELKGSSHKPFIPVVPIPSWFSSFLCFRCLQVYI